MNEQQREYLRAWMPLFVDSAGTARLTEAEAKALRQGVDALATKETYTNT